MEQKSKNFQRMSKDAEIIVSPRPEVAGKITLYKYISLKALEGLLRFGDFKVSYRKDCNDPQEMTPSGYLPHQENMYSHRGVLSFTTKSDCAPLWGNYADKFAGACIEFEFDYFNLEKLESAVESERNVFEYLEKVTALGFDVKYIKSFFDENDKMLKPSIARYLLIKCIYQKDRKRVQHNGMSRSESQAEIDASMYWWRVMCTKDADWEYEDEYRLPLSLYDVSRVNDGFPPMLFTNIPTPYIRKIILGPECKLSCHEVENMLYLSKKNINDNLLPEDLCVIKAQYTRKSYALNISGLSCTEYSNE